MRLRISSIDSSLTKHKLQEIFEEYGDVTSVKIFRSLDGTPALGFVEMKRDREAEAALSDLNGTQFGDNVLKVEVSSDVFRTHHTAVAVPPPSDDDEEDEDLDEDLDIENEEEDDEKEVSFSDLDEDDYDEPADDED